MHAYGQYKFELPPLEAEIEDRMLHIGFHRTSDFPFSPPLLWLDQVVGCATRLVIVVTADPEEEPAPGNDDDEEPPPPPPCVPPPPPCMLARTGALHIAFIAQYESSGSSSSSRAD